ncbi:acid phosphatase/Vanadium-dependent haloperoxidase [Corynespora cassiicola Philippines]|uniref:Acid phosphatase/Vanadium-dependent haloperoxidase n=1 Tax=Corynespora cassiicola Philippines TaxID=1448308 RepID=A0A2T2N391_CORCC|nr:acid phosphatase/Vanadium-dependent haloperoxidase [Corynespora cassiicola Philippines]
MKVTVLFSVLASVADAAYSGDIVQYWVDQSAVLVNGTVIGGLQSPPSGWFEAIVQGAVYLAATQSQSESLEFQQLAVSHAAHDSLLWTFHGTRLYATVNSKLKAILGPIGLNASSPEATKATTIGREAARTVVIARADDGINYFVDYDQQPALPGVYQATPGGQPIPDTPQARFIRLFGGVGDVTRFRAPPPPNATSPEYEPFLDQVKSQGARNSTVRTPYDTETAYYWRESSPIGWNRLANAVVGNSLATDVLASAKFYAQLNYALANAAIASWDSKYYYNSWRPVTAIRRTDVYLASGRNVSDPSWTPLLTPTPNHQDYLSTHATFGGAAAEVIRAWNGGDTVNVTLSSNVTFDNVGVITRRITNLTAAAYENGDSRVFGGIHFQFASDVGNEVGFLVGRETLAVFDNKWNEF